LIVEQTGGGRERLMATIKDISRLANVSTASVSKVVNGDYKSVSESTRDKILQIAKELNYKPNRLARSLVTNQTNILGLIVPDITNPYFSSLAKGVEDRAGSCGYNVILCNTDDNQAKEATYIDVAGLGLGLGGVVVVDALDVPDVQQTEADDDEHDQRSRGQDHLAADRRTLLTGHGWRR
jgi:LacI family transcriptional regulator